MSTSTELFKCIQDTHIALFCFLDTLGFFFCRTEIEEQPFSVTVLILKIKSTLQINKTAFETQQ